MDPTTPPPPPKPDVTAPHSSPEMDSATSSPSPAMDSSIWQRLPNELIENIFNCADPADKSFCAAICLTNKVGRRVMYGVNDKGENVGPSPMYGSVGITDLNCAIEGRCRCLRLLVRTLLERPDLLESVTTLTHLISSSESRYHDIEHPGFDGYAQKIRSMNLPIDIIPALTPNRKIPRRTKLRRYEGVLWAFLNVISTNLKSIEVSHASDLLALTMDIFEDLEQARVSSDKPATLGRTGMDSLSSVVYSPVGYGIHQGIPHALGLGLPRLRRLTIYNVSDWHPSYLTYGSCHVEEINLIDCLPDKVLCVPVGSRPSKSRKCLLAVCVALKKLRVTWKGPLEWEFLSGKFGSRLASELNQLPALEEICFAAIRPTLSLNCPNDGTTTYNYNGLCSKAAAGRLGSIKNLFNLKKLTLPMTACVGRNLTIGYLDLLPGDEPPGAHQNFINFLQHSLPDDVSQLEMSIVSPKSRLSAEDDVLLASASFKDFKSLTIYNCTQDSCISSLDQAAQVQNAVEASLFAM